MSEWMAESIDWKQVRKDAGLPPGSEKALIEGYFYALKNPPEGSHLFTEELLAAALEKYYPGLISGPRVEDYPPSKTRKGMQMARAIIAAAKEAERENE